PGEATAAKGPLPAGDYALYQMDRPEAASTSRQDNQEAFGLRGMFSLPAAGPVDFEKGESGQLFARIGDEKIPLPPGHYCWRNYPAKGEGPTRWQRAELALNKAGNFACEVVLLTGLLCLGAGLVVLYVMAAGHSE